MSTEKKVSPFVSAGGTTSFLLNASRVNSYEAVNISSDVKMFDWGTFASLGIDINLWEKDVLQANSILPANDLKTYRPSASGRRISLVY